MKTKFVVTFKEAFKSEEDAWYFAAVKDITDSVEVEKLEENESDEIMTDMFMLSDEEWNELMSHEGEVELNVPDYD